MDALSFILHSKLFTIYLCVFIFAFVFRRLRHQTVILNGIWFSEDGDLPEEVLSNCVDIAKKIRQSRYRRNYRFILWLDREKLKPKLYKTLRKQRIEVRDYRSISPLDEDGRKIKDWIIQLVNLGTKEMVFPYAMASDLLRLYLLLKEFPSRYPQAITCYLDCNDINLKSIPNPWRLRRVETLAFAPHQLKLDFLTYPEIREETWPIFDNDSIIAVNRNNQDYFAQIFTAYVNNLRYTDQLAQGLLPAFAYFRDHFSTLNDVTLISIIMTTSHIVHTLAPPEKDGTCFLLSFSEEGLTKQVLKPIRSTLDFLEISGSKKARTWMLHTEENELTTEPALGLRKISLDKTRQFKPEVFWGAKEAFEFIHRENYWGSSETRSGPGSELKKTQMLRPALEQLLDEYKIHSILDASCGDFNWMKEVNLKQITYLGVDIVGELIDANKKQYGSSKRTFLEADIITASLPPADLILCRDCFIHWPNKEILTAIANFKKSGAKYLLATHHLSRKDEDYNQPIWMGDFRRVNLRKAPFDFPPPLKIIREFSDEQADKFLALWELQTLPD